MRPDDPGMIERAGRLADQRPPDWVREVAALPSETLAATVSRWLHFQILERVGRGSFGEVYRARDTRLDCEVALKLVPLASSGDETAASAAPDALALGEARMLARVRHPHVVSVHGAEVAEGYAGVWMEFVQGRTLADFVRDQGPLSAREAAHIGIALCGALSAVHQAGLLHLDVKANNVMRERGGRVVLMDFGAGHDLHRGRPDETQWQGTPAYMAPELFRGGKPTTAADIYSLAVLLFFLVSGEFPVVLPPSSSFDDLRAAHREGAARRRLLRDARPDVPAPFAEAVERGLAADPGGRPATPGEFEALLRHATGDARGVLHGSETTRGYGGPAWTRGLSRHRLAWWVAPGCIALAVFAALRLLPNGPPKPPRIMVVPWQDESGSDDLRWMRTGIMDALIRALGGFTGCRVVSRHTVVTSLAAVVPLSAALPFPPIRDTAREVGADYLVSGSFARRSGGVRIVCELTRLEDGSSLGLWEDTLPEGGDFAASVAALARQIGGALDMSGRHETDGRNHGSTYGTESIEALREYLLGQDDYERGADDDAAIHFRRAVEADPSFAGAHFALMLVADSETERNTHLELAWKHRFAAPFDIRRLVEAEWLYKREQYDDAAAAYREILAADPEHTLARGMLAALYVTTHRFHEADGEYAVLHAVNPLNYSFYWEWAHTDCEIERWDKARARLEEWRTRFPASADPLRCRVELDRISGEYDHALAWCDSLSSRSEAAAIASRWLVLVHLGRRREADASLRRLGGLPEQVVAPGRDFSYRAYVALSGGRYREGLALVEEARKREDDFYNLWLAGILAAQAGRLAKAQDFLRSFEGRLGSLPPGTDPREVSPWRLFLYHLRARVELARGRPERAVEEMRACVSRTGALDDSFFRPDLGAALLAAGSPAEAGDEYRRVLHTNPRHPDALLGLGRALCAQGLKEEARAPLLALREVWKGGDDDDPLKSQMDSLLALAGANAIGR